MLDSSDTKQPSHSERLLEVAIDKYSYFGSVGALSRQGRSDHAVKVIRSITGDNGHWNLHPFTVRERIWWPLQWSRIRTLKTVKRIVRANWLILNLCCHKNPGGGWGLAKNYHFSNNPFPNKLYVPFRSMRWIISSGWNDSVRIFVVTEWPTRERICERTCQRIRKFRHKEISQRQLAFKYNSCVSKLNILKKPNWEKETRRLFSKRGGVEFWLALETNPANGQSGDWNKEYPH